MTISYEDVRLRNLKIKVSHAILENNSLVFSEKLSEDDLKHHFYFKERDIKSLEDNPSIFSIISSDVKQIIEKHNNISRHELKILEMQLERDYKEMKTHFESFKVNNKFIEEKLKQVNEVSCKLHWYYLPVYSEEFIVNRDIIPETDLRSYYDHFHSVEDLYRHIFEPTKAIDWKSTGGDVNLGKKLDFKVYTCRWGHYDNYTFIRTYNGWKISAFADIINCRANGEAIEEGKSPYLNNSGLYYFLKHDSVQYPEDGIKYSLSELWKEADSNEMSYIELQEKLGDIANWISEVEKATHEHQPTWCRYY